MSHYEEKDPNQINKITGISVERARELTRKYQALSDELEISIERIKQAYCAIRESLHSYKQDFWESPNPEISLLMPRFYQWVDWLKANLEELEHIRELCDIAMYYLRLTTHEPKAKHRYNSPSEAPPTSVSECIVVLNEEAKQMKLRFHDAETWFKGGDFLIFGIDTTAYILRDGVSLMESIVRVADSAAEQEKTASFGAGCTSDRAEM